MTRKPFKEIPWCYACDRRKRVCDEECLHPLTDGRKRTPEETQEALRAHLAACRVQS